MGDLNHKKSIPTGFQLNIMEWQVLSRQVQLTIPNNKGMSRLYWICVDNLISFIKNLVSLLVTLCRRSRMIAITNAIIHVIHHGSVAIRSNPGLHYRETTESKGKNDQR